MRAIQNDSEDAWGYPARTCTKECFICQSNSEIPMSGGAWHYLWKKTKNSYSYCFIILSFEHKNLWKLFERRINFIRSDNAILVLVHQVKACYGYVLGSQFFIWNYTILKVCDNIFELLWALPCLSRGYKRPQGREFLWDGGTSPCTLDGRLLSPCLHRWCTRCTSRGARPCTARSRWASSSTSRRHGCHSCTPPGYTCTRDSDARTWFGSVGKTSQVVKSFRSLNFWLKCFHRNYAWQQGP